MAISGRILGRSAKIDAEVRIAGLRELLAGLSELPVELGKGAIYAALGGAARVVKDAAIANAPVVDGNSPMVQAGYRSAGTMKRAIRASRSKINKGQNGFWETIVRVKPLKKSQEKKLGKRGAKNPNDPYYWWWVEFGTSKMAARPFLRPAFNDTKDAQLEAMRKRMRAGIERAAKKIEQEVRRAA